MPCSFARFATMCRYAFIYRDLSGKDSGCFADLGYIRGLTGHRVHLGVGCCKHGTIVHELMHVLGALHEQNRPDRFVVLSRQRRLVVEG